MIKAKERLPSINCKGRSKFRKLCLPFLVFVFVLGGILFGEKENVYADNATNYVNRSGYFYLNVYVDNEKVSRYRLDCSLSCDIPNDGSLAPTEYTGGWRFYVQDGQWWVSQTLTKQLGTDTVYTNGYAWTDSDGAAGLPYNTRQYAWFFPLKTNLTGYHLKTVTLDEGGIQSACWGGEDGKFWVMVDTNGMGVTNFFEGDWTFHHNTFNVWLEANEYTLNLNPNGGTIDGTECASGIDNTVTYGKETTIPGWANSSHVGMTGYTLTGWYDSAGTKVINADGSKNLDASAYWDSSGKWTRLSDATLYAQWTPNTYTINFNPNGGTIDGNAYTSGVDVHTYYTDSNIYQGAANFGNKAPDWAVPNRTYREGYTLLGWYDTANTKVFNADGSKNLEATNYWDSAGRYIRLYNSALYAQWKLNYYDQTINYYTYNASGPYNDPTHIWNLLGSKTWSLAYGTTFDAYSKRSEWGKVAGYHYWCINDNSWTVTGNRGTNSHYYPNTYRLNVSLNKGSGSTTPDGTSGNFDMEYGTYINLGTPVMTGYTFSGWSITEHNSIGHSLSANTFTMGYNKSYPNQSYTSGSTVKIKAKWNTNSYNLIYDLNDSTGSTRAQFGAYHPNTVKFDIEFTVSNPSRAGYTFAGWNITGMDNSTHYYGAYTTVEGYIDNTCETIFKNLNSSNEAVVTFKAVWIPNTYTMHFDGNGAAGGNVDDITVRYDENMTLPANGYELDKNTFVGWTHDCTAHVGTYAEGQEILSSVIIDAAGMTTQNNGIIYLYCAWDPAPNITVLDKTFSLDEARNGLITEERLFEGAYAMDEILDSEILPGTHLLENGSCNSFTITNFSEDEFTQFTASGSASITYQVVDSVGNITEETITVFIVDNTPKEPQSGEGTYHVRFISDKYYDKTEVEGGLPEDSIWRKRPEYVELLSEVMEK